MIKTYSVLAVSHKMYKLSLEIHFMEKAIDYRKSEDKISIQNMQLSVTNLIPRFPYPAEESRRQEVSARLFAIFEKQDV